MAASSSSAAASSSSASALPGDSAVQNLLPAHLLDALRDARPPCPFYATKRGCRKGRKCKLSHGECNSDHIPHISRHIAENGSTYITLRPPLLHGLEKYFEQRKCPLPVSNGQTWRLENGSFVVTFATSLMQAPDMLSCSEAKTRGFAGNRDHSAYASPRAFSGLLLHSTSVPNALSILCDGRINASPGICGEGIYGFEVASHDNESLEQAWHRGVSGGYGWGAAFLLRSEGILCNANAHLPVVPCGAVFVKRDQFAVAPKTASFLTATFARDALMGAIGAEMDSLGYSQKLHQALADIQQHFEKNGNVGPLPDSAKLLHNACVLKHDKGHKRRPPAAPS